MHHAHVHQLLDMREDEGYAARYDLAALTVIPASLWLTQYKVSEWPEK